MWAEAGYSMPRLGAAWLAEHRTEKSYFYLKSTTQASWLWRSQD